MKVKRERGWTGNSWGGISLGPPDPGPNGGKHPHSVDTFNIDCVFVTLGYQLSMTVVIEEENGGSSRVHRGISRERLL